MYMQHAQSWKITLHHYVLCTCIMPNHGRSHSITMYYVHALCPIMEDHTPSLCIMYMHYAQSWKITLHHYVLCTCIMPNHGRFGEHLKHIYILNLIFFQQIHFKSILSNNTSRLVRKSRYVLSVYLSKLDQKWVIQSPIYICQVF